MANFKVGDVCVIVSSATNPDYVGCEVTIIGPLETYTDMDDGIEYQGHEVEGPNVPVNDEWANMCAPHELRLKRPPQTYDGLSTGDWDLCPWRPTKERVGG